MRRHDDERGAALVEFALILPLLVMFVFGIVEFGRFYNTRIQLTSAVREGARAAALGSDPTAATRAGAPGLDPTKIIVSYTPMAGSTCTGASTTTTVLSTTTTATTVPTATVTATYQFDYTIPLLRSGHLNVSATGVFRCGA